MNIPIARGSRRFRRTLATVGALTLASGLLAACGGNGDTIEANEEGNRVIRVAAPFVSTMNSAFLYGAGAGIFDKYDIETEFVEIDGARGLAASMGGSVDMAITSAVNPLAALEQDQAFYVIAQVGNGFPESVLIETEAYEKSGLDDDSTFQEKIEFLKDKPWGVSSPEGSSVYMARYMFELAGLSQDDFNANSLGSSSGTLAALQEQKVVAGSMGSPLPQVAEAEGYAKVFLDVTAGEVPELQNTLTSVVAVTPEFYENNRELVDDFREALAEAQSLVYNDSETVDEWMYENHFDGSPKEAVLAGVASQRAGGSIAQQPEVDPEAADKLVSFMRATGQPITDDYKKIFMDFPEFEG
ncbi:ABC transporter substrate-binding protein [Nocardioides sp.]|jgi:ABC-type nitrate/sulfonate/bicarbonate transport system substrate-binding protein|uniref:ABC transporter substrate-binding protein n=1 Tax=Nocardioides sp. TaxID=35761 RepID=UPI002601E893|nr:ABC transporter substrate-binding protein [Nocardioides sp.]